MKTKAITTIIVTLFLASMLSMAFITPAKAQYLADAYTVGLWHLNKEFGTALNFDNVDDYVAVSYSSSLDFTAVGQDFSFEAWINSAVEDYDYIFQQLWDGTGRTWLYLTPDGAVSSYIGGADTMTATGVITSGKWHHVALTFDKGIGSQVGTLKIYVDGEMKASSTQTFDALAQVGYRIGIDGTQWPFNGKIDEVRISNVVRTSFDLSKPLTVDGNTVALWHFDEGTGYTAYDSSPNSNHGTLVNMDPATAWVDSTIPIAIDSSGYDNHGTIYGANWVDGKFGKALEFDGVDDYINIPDDPTLDITGDITLEAWIRKDVDKVQHVIGKDQPDVGENRGYYLGFHADGKVVFFLTQEDGTTYGTKRWIKSDNPLENGVWYHIMGTWDGSIQKLYVNGVLQTSTISWSGSIRTNDLDLCIGRKKNFWPSYWVYFNGIIDEVRISNVARGPVDVLAPETLNLRSQGEWITSYIEPEVLFGDNFDTETTGGDPSKWTVTEPTATDVLIDETVYYGACGKSVKLEDNSLSDRPWIIKTFPPQSGKLVAQGAVRLGQTDAIDTALYISIGVYPYPISVAFWSDGYIKYAKPAALGYLWENIQTYSADTWYVFKVVVDIPNQEYDLYIDDMAVPKVTDTAFRFPATTLDTIFYTTTISTKSVMWIDDVTITPMNIDVSTVWLTLGGEDIALAASDAPMEIGDYDVDGIADLMVKFDRSTVTSWLSLHNYAGLEVMLTISGTLLDGTPFEYYYTVRVIEKGKPG